MSKLRRGLLWWGPQLSLDICIDSRAPICPAHTSSCGPDYSWGPWDCPHTARPNRLPRSVCWSLSVNVQLLIYSSRYASQAGAWREVPGSSVQFSLCPVCCKPVAVLWASEAPYRLLASERGSQGEGPDSFFPLLSYPVIWWFFFPALVVKDLLPAFSGYSLRIIPLVDVFLMYLWEEVSSTSFYIAILISQSAYCFLTGKNSLCYDSYMLNIYYSYFHQLVIWFSIYVLVCFLNK